MRKRITIIGGGLAGLTAAATAARAGAEVLVLEARRDLGGRARTQDHDGFLFNQGPHALYATGAGVAVLADLGITPRGKKPPLRAYGRLRGRIGLLPGSPVDSLRSSLIGPRAKLQLGRVLARPRAALATPLAGRSMQQWIEEQVADRDARLVLAMAARTATYLDDMTRIAAVAAVPQLIAAITGGVWYLDGGWQQLVEAVRAVALDAGAKIDTDAKVDDIDDIDDINDIDDVNHVDANVDALIIATGSPAQAAALLGGRSAAMTRWAEDAEPVYASSLDLGLRSLPEPRRRICLAVDDPLYLSTHTPSAALAPGGGEVVHVLRYGPPGEDPRAEMERFLDEVQPGWRAQVVAQRFGRQWLVAGDRPRPGLASLAERPGPAVPDCKGVFVAGDWVGGSGLLADAALASGRDAAIAALSPR